MNEWRERARLSISQGALTNSKNPKMLIDGLYPSHIRGGHGCHIYDYQDTKYIDYICGLGTNLFGYGNDHINRELVKSMYHGFSHSLPTYHEVEAAEKIKEMFPSVDLVKFLKSGSEACSAAIRIARAMTGRSLILSHGYHGWHDLFTSMSKPAKGCPDKHDVREFQTFEQITKDVAAVIIEPVITCYDKQRMDWLREIRAKCDETGTILIFDEVITGFRFKNYSVTEYSGVDPDLICLGKAIANGLPLACVAGKRELMDDPRWFVSSTYAGEVFSLIACKKVVDLLLHNADYDINELWKMGAKFIEEFNKFSTELKIDGYPTRGVFKGHEKTIALFMQEMAKLNILFCKSWFYNFPLMTVQNYVLDSAEVVLNKIDRGAVNLEYPLPASPFSMGARR